MGDWSIEGDTIRKSGGGPFTSCIQEFRWTGTNWIFFSQSEDRAPGHMVPVCESDKSKDEHPINAHEASELMEIYGLTEEDISLDLVLKTPPDELQRIASEKKS